MKKILITLTVVSLTIATAFDLGSISKNIEKAKDIKKDVKAVKQDIKDKNYTKAKDDGSKVIDKAKIIYSGKEKK